MTPSYPPIYWHKADGRICHRLHLRRRRLLMARSGHSSVVAIRSAFDPKRTLPAQYGGLAMCLSDLPRVICGRLGEDKRGPILRLGSVHGEVSVVNDRFRRCAVIRDQRSTDGGADRVRMFADLDLALEAPDKAQSNRVSGISVDIVAKHGELISAEPSEKIAGTSDCPKAPRNHLQDPIPERVTVKIIDRA